MAIPFGLLFGWFDRREVGIFGDLDMGWKRAHSVLKLLRRRFDRPIATSMAVFGDIAIEFRTIKMVWLILVNRPCFEFKLSSPETRALALVYERYFILRSAIFEL